MPSPIPSSPYDNVRFEELGLVEGDTHKIVYHFGHSTIEVIHDNSPPEVVAGGAPGFDEKKPSKELMNNQKRNCCVSIWAGWSHKRRWITLGVPIILVILIIVVSIVGRAVTISKSTDNPALADDGPRRGVPPGFNETLNPKPGTNFSQSICNGDPRNQIRRQVLSADYIDNKLMLFGRNKEDNGIYYLSLPSMSSSPVWERLLAPETFLSPPTTMTWDFNGTRRLSLFAVSSHLSNVLTASYFSGKGGGGWDQKWTNLGGSSISTVSLCKMPRGSGLPENEGIAERIDQYIIESNTRDLAHKLWYRKVDSWLGYWDRAMVAPPLGTVISKSAPALICGKGSPFQSVLLYSNETDSVKLRHLTLDPWGWTDWVDLGGRFMGDPVTPIFNPESDTEREFHFLGTGVNGRIYSFKWNNGTDATSAKYKSELIDLGGDFGSVPSVVITVSKNKLRQMHVVAARRNDGGLMHKVYQNGGWKEGWEDLEVKVKSAPFVFGWLDGSSRNHTGLAYIDYDDELMFASWETVDDLSWKGLLKWTKFGGNLSAESVCL
ncbi:hypothetical protein QBC38DRAFT_548801 [Podospora fimiseda]|uniref:Fucose-specific lectin n=1 Tax=Podospora fimiseda TaxID=252190 RepID=A0AAN6YPE7_9PEZI|nr:hypothetical protein QBC38DRAFT_548801 [Podospora fimiseda]